MERRNLFFDIELTDAQWRKLERTADTLGPDRGFQAGTRSEGPYETQPIQVFLDEGRGLNAWRGYLTAPEGSYGPRQVEVASVHFNGGRPFASIDFPPETVAPPTVSRTRERQMEEELESWLRNRWDELMRASGIHYDRGHFPTSGSQEEERFR